MELKTSEILKNTNGELITGNADSSSNGCSIDSRNVPKKGIFAALFGSNFNGHDFMNDAIENGANTILFEHFTESLLELKRLTSNDVNFIKVDDVKIALGKLGKYCGKLLNVPFIAITGSNGKTTTKELISHFLENEYKVLKTKGNHNNNLGVPLTLLNASKDVQIGVIEMGMNHVGEINYLSDMIKPATSIILNIGSAHIGELGSKEKILKAKLEIINHLKPNGILYLNLDDELLKKTFSDLKEKINVKTFSIFENSANLIANNISISSDKTEFNLNFKGQLENFKTNLLGMGNLHNILAAISVSIEYGIELKTIAKSLFEFRNYKNRQQIYKNQNSVFIDDCYNASPESFKDSIDVTERIFKNHNKNFIDAKLIGIFGDMKELGSFSKAEHINLGREISKIGFKIIFYVGEFAKDVYTGIKQLQPYFSSFYDFLKVEDVIDVLWNPQNLEPFVTLCKGSRACELEKISDYILKKCFN